MSGTPAAHADAPPAAVRLRDLRPRRTELRELWRLALPVVVVQVGMQLMSAVDAVMVGHVGPAELAAVALGSLYWFTVTVFGLGTLLALDPIVSQAFGAGDPEGIARALQRGVLLALGLTAVALLGILPVRPVLALLRQPAEVVPIAAGYVLAAAWGILPFYLFVVLRQTLQAMGRLRPIVVTVVLANLANALFNWVLVYGKAGFPALGAPGAGWASSLSRWLMALGVLVGAWPLLRDHVRPLRREAARWRPLARMVRVGTPIGVQFSLEFGAFAATGLLMGLLGTVQMAGHQVALNLASLTFMVPLGVAQATSVLVGRAVGREDTPGARRAAGAGLAIGAAFMCSTAALFLLLPDVLARLYSGDAPVVALAALLIPIAGLFQVFDGLQVVASAVLRGIGDTRAPMVLNILSFWAIGLPVSVLLGFGMGAGAVGLWWGIVAGLAAVAVLLLLRVRHRFGGELRRLIIEDPAVAPMDPEPA